MQQQTRLALFVITLLLMALSACVPAAINKQSTGINQNEVASIVAATLQAELGQGDRTETEDEGGPQLTVPSLLPHSLYFLGNAEGIRQVWRLEANGTSLQMLSSSSSNVDDYDVSPADGTVAYVSANRLYLITADGRESQVLIDASAADKSADDYYYRSIISSPHFSPDGQTLAYALNGIWLLDIISGTSRHILENQLEEPESGTVFPRELFFPESWSPNGDKLLVAIAYLEAGTLAFLDPADGHMTPLIASGIVCCQSQWAPDNGSILVASPYIGLIESGLWRYDANTGVESLLIAGNDADSVFNFVGWPLQVETGDLYYFYTSTAGFPDGDIPLLMVRSPADGLTERQQLRTDSLIVREALWAEDGSLALIVQSQQGTSGPMVLAKTDGSPLLILANEAEQLRWGP